MTLEQIVATRTNQRARNRIRPSQNADGYCKSLAGCWRFNMRLWDDALLQAFHKLCRRPLATRVTVHGRTTSGSGLGVIVLSVSRLGHLGAILTHVPHLPAVGAQVAEQSPVCRIDNLKRSPICALAGRA